MCEDVPRDVVEATETAIKAAKHLTSADRGAVETLRYLARKIDTEDKLREMALDWAAENKQRPPSVDNVSVPTYLKFCDALGLTPAGRERLTAKNDDSGGKLAQLRAVHGGDKPKKSRSA